MKVFEYDGSFEGYLTALFDTYSIKDDVNIIRQDKLQLILSETEFIVYTSNIKAERLFKGIKEKLGNETLNNIYHLFLCDIDDSDDLALEYLKLCFNNGKKINLAKHNSIIAKVDKYCRKVTFEAHNFTGFVRFNEIGPMTFYSSIEPDHNILPLLVKHFEQRFSDQNFIIHDLKRETAIAYNRVNTEFFELTEEHGQKLRANIFDRSFEELWIMFYESINIKERQNERLRRQLLPKRYWKHLTELKA